MGAAQVPHPEHQTELVVSQGDDGVFGEHQRLRSFVGLRDLHKHAADLDGEKSRKKKHTLIQKKDRAEMYVIGKIQYLKIAAALITESSE